MAEGGGVSLRSRLGHGEREREREREIYIYIHFARKVTTSSTAHNWPWIKVQHFMVNHNVQMVVLLCFSMLCALEFLVPWGQIL